MKKMSKATEINKLTFAIKDFYENLIQIVNFCVQTKRMIQITRTYTPSTHTHFRCSNGFLNC